MPRLSAFTPCGHLRLSSAPSYGETFYKMLVNLYGGSQGPIDFAPSATNYEEAKLYATAMGLAAVRLTLRRAGDQSNPAKVYDLLPLQELDYLLVPGPSDTIATRRAALAARMQLPQGAKASAIVNGLKAILGTSFLAYVTATPLSGGSYQPTALPLTPGVGPGHFVDVRTPPRTMQLVDPVIAAGTQWCAYKNLDTTAGALTLVPGDVVVVQGENNSVMEKVTVLQTAITPPAGSNASPATPPPGTTTWAPSTQYAPGAYVTPTAANARGLFFLTANGGLSGGSEPAWPTAIGQSVVDGNATWVAAGGGFCFQATFTKAHDVGSSIVAGNFPYWFSTQRQAWIVTSAAAAHDPETRRKVSDYLRRAERAVVQWAIVEPATITANGGTLGPLTVGSPMGTIPIGSFSYTNSM